MGKLILGIDAGNYEGKIVGPYGADSFRTAICDWFSRDIVESFGDDDMEFEINGRKGFAGTIAAYEDVNSGGAMYGDSKAHDDTLIRVLLAIYRYMERYDLYFSKVSIVTGQPIITHKDEEKKIIQQMLIGDHNFVVNGKQVRFNIEDVGVAAEGAGAFWSQPQNDTVRIIDVGSGTVNAATVINRRFINNASDTFNFGVETSNKDMESLARDIVRSTTRLKWKRDDNVFVCGGVANNILPYIAQHYSKAQIILPYLRRNNRDIKLLQPVYSNATGFYEIARITYGE